MIMIENVEEATSDKREAICLALLPVLQLADEDIERVVYDLRPSGDELVHIKYKYGEKLVNITCDSATAMVRDIVSKI